MVTQYQMQATYRFYIKVLTANADILKGSNYFGFSLVYRNALQAFLQHRNSTSSLVRCKLRA